MLYDTLVVSCSIVYMLVAMFLIIVQTMYEIRCKEDKLECHLW